MSTTYAIPTWWIILNCLLVLALWLRSRRAEKANDDSALLDYIEAYGYTVTQVEGVWGVTDGQKTKGAPQESLRGALRAALASEVLDHG